MKTANRNLLLFVIPAVLGAILGVVLITQGDAMLSAAQSLWPDAPQGEVGDVEGYAMITGMLGAGLGSMVSMAAQLFGMMTLMYAGALLVLSVAARIVYAKTPGRILAYRIIMGVAFVVLVLPVPDILKTFVLSLAGGSLLPLWLIYLVAVCIILVMGCRGTYSRQVYH